MYNDYSFSNEIDLQNSADDVNASVQNETENCGTDTQVERSELDNNVDDCNFIASKATFQEMKIFDTIYL